MSQATLDIKVLTTDITEHWDEYRSFTPVLIDDDTKAPAVLWRTICEVCGDTIRLTLRTRTTDMVLSPMSGTIIDTTTSDCACEEVPW